MSTTIGAIDQELRGMSDAQVERAARDFTPALVAGQRVDQLTEDQLFAQRAANELTRRRMERGEQQAALQADERAAANRAAFDATHKVPGLAQKRAGYDFTI